MKQQIPVLGRTLALAVLVGLGVAPSSALSNAERALLGRTGAAFPAPKTSPPRALDGARALLGREAGAVSVKPSSDRASASPTRPVDGARALLGRGEATD